MEKKYWVRHLKAIGFIGGAAFSLCSPFSAVAAIVSSDQTISNTTYTGYTVTGGIGSGGGAGLGGVFLVDTGATLTLNNVNFFNNAANGGTGGIGSTGGSLNSLSYAAGATGATGINALVNSGAPGGDGGTGGAGAFGAGGGAGGAGGTGSNTGGDGGDGGVGGAGGFGAGGGLGGAGGSYSFAGNKAGAGGVGGLGGFGAGDGSTANGTANGIGGDGGSGYGGSIFVNSGATLNINGTSTFKDGHVLGGASVNGGTAGEGVGTDLFMMKGSTVNLNAGAGVITFNGTIADNSLASISDSAIPSGQGASININSGLVIFNGANTYSGVTNLNGGVLQAKDGVGLYTNSNLNFNGGVFQSNGIFARYTGTQAYDVQWTGNGGFAAAGGALTVALNNGLPLTWGSASFVGAGSSLIFGSTSATDAVTFTNAIDLAAGNRSILVTANAGNTDQAILTGVLSNGALTVGDATHNGVLVLTAANTYASGTTITNGTLALKDSGSLNANGVMAIAAPGIFDISQAGNQAIGDLVGAGTVNLGSKTLTINQAGNTVFSGVIKDSGIGGGTGASLTKAGVGTLALSGANTYTGTTEISGGTLTLTGTGSLASQAVRVSAGTILNDNGGLYGLDAGSALTNAGIVNLSADDTVKTFASTGTLNGSSTLTAETYALSTGSVINANLGTGAVTANGPVELNGTSAAGTFNVQTGTTVLGSDERLLDTTDLTVDAGATLVLGGAEKIGSLLGAGRVSVIAGTLTVDDGTFSGVITGSNGVTKVSTGLLTLSGANTYAGTTEISAGTLTLDLTGSIASQIVHVSSGTTLNDVNSGLSSTSALSNDGTILLGANDTVGTFASTGELNGSGYTLTAATYALNGGSVINANIGTGVVTANGTVELNGTSAAVTFRVQTGITTLGAAERLLNSTDLTVDTGATLVLGGAEKIGSLLGAGLVNINAGTLTVDDGTFSGVIAGTNGLTKVSADLLTLSGANTYTGPTNVNVGTLTLDLTGSIAGTVVNVSTGATLNDVAGGLAVGTVLTDNGTVNLGANQTIDQLLGSGRLNLNAGTLTASSGNFSGVIAGAGSDYGVTKVSADTLTLSGANTYVGSTYINAGTLNLTGNLGSRIVNVSSGATLNDVAGGLRGLHVNSTLTNAGTVNLSADDTVFSFVSTGTLNSAPIIAPSIAAQGIAPNSSSYTLTAATYALNDGSVINANLGAGAVTANGTVQLNGTSAADTFHVQTGTTTLGAAERLLDTTDLTVDAASTLVLGGAEKIGSLLGEGLININAGTFTVDDGTFSGVIAGTNGVTKVSTGTLTLSGVNTYTGPTNVDAGILDLTGSLGSNVVNVATGATLAMGSAALISSDLVTVNGTLDVANGNNLSYDLLNGSGTVGHAGSVFVNNAGETVGGNLTFLDDFTNNGILAPGNSPGVTTITGDYTEAGTLQIELQTTTAGGYDQVRVGGATTIASGGALVVQTYGGVLPSRGNEYQIISDLSGASDRVTGVFNSVTFDADGVAGSGAPVANAAAVFDVATGRLTATGLNAPGSVFANLGSNSNQGAAATALFNAAQVASNQIDTDTLVGTLAHQVIDAVGTPAGDLARYTPTFYGAMADYAFTGGRALSRAARNNRAISGGKNDECGNFYVGTLLNEDTAGDDSDVNRNDYYLGGEFAASQSLVLGALVSKNDGEIDNDLGSDDIDGTFGQVYFRQSVGRGFELSGSFGYGQSDNDLERVTMQGDVTGKSETTAYTGALGVAYKKGLNVAHAVVTPSFDLYYSSADMDEFTETGAVDALQNSGATADELVAALSASTVWNTSVWGRAFAFEVKPGLEQVLSRDAGDVTLQMKTIPAIRYEMEYLEKGETTGSIGLGMGYSVFDGATISVGYEGRVNDEFGQEINARFKMAF